jgi:MFS family permease
MQPGEPEAPQQSLRFMLLYALAAAGGAVAYVPFLSLLLPMRVAAIAESADVAWLGTITFSGAVAASLGHIAFGWLSDVTGTRRAWIAAGLTLTCLLLLAVTQVRSLPTMIGVVVVWQLALNMMLGPLAAWAGDCVPDRQKGLLGGLLAFAPALGALVGALVTIRGLAGPDGRLALVAALVACMVLPALLFGAPRPMPQLMEPADRKADGESRIERRREASVRMWFARLLVQVAEAALLAYLLFWLATIDSDMRDAETARVFAVVLGVAVPTALLAGRWSDRRGRPIFPLVVSAFLAALGLLVMALAESLAVAVAGYVLFGITASVFLALHSGQTLRVLPRPERRGRDLGVFNLTNTVPQVVMPGLALALVPRFGFDALFLLLAGLATLAGLLLATMPRVGQTPER